VSLVLAGGYTASMEPSRERDGDKLWDLTRRSVQVLQWSRRANATETVILGNETTGLPRLQWSRRANATDASGSGRLGAARLDASMEPSRERDGDGSVLSLTHNAAVVLQWSRRANATETSTSTADIVAAIQLQWSRRANATETPVGASAARPVQTLQW